MKPYFCMSCQKDVGANAADNHAADGHHVERRSEKGWLKKTLDQVRREVEGWPKSIRPS